MRKTSTTAYGKERKIANDGRGQSQEPTPAATPTPLARIDTLSPEGALLHALPTPVPTATPYRVPEHLDRIPVAMIELDFRRVNAADSPSGIGSGTSEHAFIVISRDNGFKQVLSLDPVPLGDAMKGTAQGTFIAGFESKSDIAQPAHRFELTPPSYPGLDRSQALTHYANELVAGARAYNEHPLRYDVPAGEGYNSNSWAASLVVAKGGEAGMADVRRIAERMDGRMPLLHETAGARPPWKPGDDLRESQNVVQAIDAGAPIAPGFHNASIPHDRFGAGPIYDHVAAYPKPAEGTMGVGLDALKADRGGAIFHTIGTYLGATANDARHATAAAIGRYFNSESAASATTDVNASVEPRLPGQPIHVERDGAVREYGAGYAQNGRITEIAGDRVTQHTGRGDVSYSLSELAAQSRDPLGVENALRSAFESKSQAAISYGRDGYVSVSDLGQERIRSNAIDMSR
jgi:hypothetical protein